ncbi:hypothetical protein TIFTF001_030593 [Ficus carica]|uniref:RING-type domain-containing protein n=1 Tax=Ficus carica TaxID=3494 RepID=A0AA88DTY6_FICCA|nr:hypothetical protein TIFTF001_030593 [Ficus carica]
MMRLMELENAMDRTTYQYDRLNKASNDIENGNAEIRAEIEAHKLRTSKSDEKLAKVVTKKKKSVKKILSLEKHIRRLLEEIEQDRKKSLQLQQQMLDLKAAQEHLEVVWRQEVKAKELALNELQEELRLKEEAEVKIKRRQQAFHQKMETDHLKHKGEIQRLEQEIAHLEMSSEASGDTYHLPEYLFSWESKVLQTNADTFQNQLPGPGSSEWTGLSENEVTYDRVCMICMEKEVSVLFLTCAHQVLCAKCNNDCCDKMEGLTSKRFLEE